MRFDEYRKHDALGLADRVARGDVTAAELLDLAIARADAVNPQINALVRRFDARARQQIAGGLQGPFAGVPFLLKDLMADYAGEVTSSGSAMFADYVPQQDSELVRRYKAAGLVIFGKTNTPELGLTPFTEPRLFGPARNPWNLAHTPGGSSGGSGAAIAAGIVPMANGGDGGGSIRIPASCNGLVGYKPSRGLIPHGPHRGDAWWGYATEHVLTRSVRDSAAALDATAGADAGCPYSTHIEPVLPRLQEAPPRLRIAFSAEPMTGLHMHADCRTGLAGTVQHLQDLGHELIEAAPRIDREAFVQSFVTMLTGETAAELRAGAQALGRRLDLRKVEPATRALARLGRAVSAEESGLARLHMNRVTRDIGHWFQNYDVLLTPTLGMPPFKIGALQASLSEQIQLALLNGLPIASLIKSGKLLLQTAAKTFEWMPNTPVFNVTGQPSISLPLHWNADGLPVGMMLSAKLGDDALLLRLAAQIEQAYPWFDKRPQL
ncbi:MAG: amidase [Panacagrimonas sp.]